MRGMPQDRRWRVTRIGWVIIVVLVVAVVVGLVAGGAVRFVALGVGGLVLLLVASEGLSGPGDVIGGRGRKDEVLHQAPPRTPDDPRL
jgi:hypothetical protein